MINKKENKHKKHDDTRKALPRLPSSRIADENKADVMEQLYLINSDGSKLDVIIDAARFALDNKELFIEYRNKLKNKQ